MTSVRRRAWWVLVFFAAVLVLFGVTDLQSGAAADPLIAAGITGRTLAQLESDSPAAVRLYDFASRGGGLNLILIGVLLTALLAGPYRVGQRWAWWALWTLPAWALGVFGLNLAFGVAPGQAPPPPMVSGPIVAAIAAVVLLIDVPRFPREATGSLSETGTAATPEPRRAARQP